MVHLKDVFVDYGYLTELIGKLMNEVHDDDMEAPEETRKEINKYAIVLENPDFPVLVILSHTSFARRLFFQTMGPCGKTHFTKSFCGYLDNLWAKALVSPNGL